MIGDFVRRRPGADADRRVEEEVVSLPGEAAAEGFGLTFLNGFLAIRGDLDFPGVFPAGPYERP